MKRIAIERLLARAERAIALVERCRPLNAVAEQKRLREGWRSGRRLRPEFVYASRPDLSELRRVLEAIAEGLEHSGMLESLYARRAAELAIEAAAAEHVDLPEFAARAALRFPVDDGEDGRRALELAERWSAEPPPSDGAEPCHVSDDERDPQSLIAALRRAVGERRLAFRVRAVADLQSAAASGDSIILVRTGLRQRANEVARIVVHEIEGHALVRARAAREPLGLFAVGSARGADDEEGRALHLEQSTGHLDARRRSELGRRHLAAVALRGGADFVEVVELLVERNASHAEALDVAARIHRGGGLGREIVYLPALCRVSSALDSDPELQSFLERGRLSVDAARTLRAITDPLVDTLRTPARRTRDAA